MPIFRYEALDNAGRSRFGSLDALTPRGQVPQGGFGGAGDILSALNGMMARR